MSGYRSYVPWKSSLPYKSGSTSTYSSRDDVNTANDTKSRFGLVASPAAFRPSYSGGTYRSVKRDTPLVVPIPKNYASPYSSATTTNKDTKDTGKVAQSLAQSTVKSNLQPAQQKYAGSSTGKNLDSSVSKFSTSTGNLAKFGRKSRDPSPAVERRSNISVARAKSRDPSPLADRRHSGSYSTSTSNLTKFGYRSRDPSPAASDLRINPGLQNNRNLRGRSRDPSPVNVQYKSSLGSSQSSYGSSYRLGQRSSKAYAGKHSSTNTSSSSSSGVVPDKALSYMSISDFRARSVSRTHDCTKKLEKLALDDADSKKRPKSEVPTAQNGIPSEKSEADREENLEPEVFVSVTVVTRGTSPTPPGASTIVRTRRLELAKTIEKTIQRSSRKPTCFDKEIQSDRLDDTSRYSRFSSASRLSTSPWSSPYSSDTKFARNEGPKYNSSANSSSSYSSKANKTESEQSDKKKKDETVSSKSGTSSSKSSLKDKSRSSTDLKSSKSSSKVLNSPAKQRSSDNLNNAQPRSLPPAIPKGESPTKSVSTSSGSARWPNKDFRKSALNVGPTDRPRKSRTPSTGTDTDEKNEQQKLSSAFTRSERSPSVGSEAGSSSSSVSCGHLLADDKNHENHVEEAVTSFDRDCNQTRESITYAAEQVPKENASSESYNKSFGMRDDREPQDRPSEKHNAQNVCQLRSPNVCPVAGADSSKQLVAKNEDVKSMLMRTLGSIPNFFVTRSQGDSSGETIFLDNSSGDSVPEASLSSVLKENALTTTASVSPSQVLNPTIAVTSNTNSDLDESSWWQNTSQQIDTESALDLRDDMKYKLRHIDSGEMAWWMKSDSDRGSKNREDDTIADDLRTLNQQNDLDTDPDRSDRTDRILANETKRSASRDIASWWTASNTESPLKEKSPRIKRIDSGERAWWLDEPNEKEMINSDGVSQLDNDCVNQSVNYSANHSPNYTVHSPNHKLSTLSEGLVSSFQTNGSYNVEDTNQGYDYSKPVQSSISENEVIHNHEKSPQVEQPASQYKIPWWMEDTSQTLGKKSPLFKIRHVESGERAWWLSDSNDSSSRNAPVSHPESRQLTPKLNSVQRADSGEKAWWLQEESAENQTSVPAPEDDEIARATLSANHYKRTDNSFPLNHSLYEQLPPLGDRRSPEGLEDTSKNRKSPYQTNNNPKTSEINSYCSNNNIPPSSTRIHLANAQRISDKLFISRHTNIDDVLGGSCRPLSPLLNIFNNGNLGTKADTGIFFEEISPQQVRIHDSTAQMPVIQHMGRDEWDYVGANQYPQYQLDDAAIQVYKDGDYGAYLDLESSLAEQAEEIEGLDTSRKNSLVVRTQLSVRVHAIIEKLLSSEGSELRRALFSLKQIFQEDKDLVHGFVALGGLNCLVRVGNVADQNYQNYILRALGQVMLYVDGMNGVMKHSPTIQWLYSLIASKYRLVVKTALKLLLVFVEYVETNCNLLVQAVHAVDKAHRTLPWSNIMKLLKDYENADTELLIYATSLVNKTLSGLSDQDSFYDESDFLEQQGMEGVVQRYMSRPGTDLDLLDQLQLYEAVLKFEDGEADGIRIRDDSIRKTLRLRNTDSTERRKSRRHSTGTSPMTTNVPSPKRSTPPSQSVLDEDSSSSNNSNEFNGGVFLDCKGQREGAGVTPGLRRRRERAERQKSFMREQQEALANGMRTPFDLNGSEQNELGQIVTAVPVHLRNGNDSPPESLILRPGNPQPVNNNNSDTCTTPKTKMYSPVKNVLSNTSISVISNGFEKKSINGNGGITPERTPLHGFSQQNSVTGKRGPPQAPDFVNSRNLVNMANNIAAGNGVGKYGESKNNALTRRESLDRMKGCNSNNAPNNNTSFLSRRSKLSNESNRLNNYYNHLSPTSKNSNFTTSILNQKNLNLNGPTKGNMNTGSAGYMNGTSITNKNNSTGQPTMLRMTGSYKDIKMVSNMNGKGLGHSLNADSSELQTNANSQGITPVSNGNSKKLNGTGIGVNANEGDSEYDEKRQSLQIRRDHTVKDLTQKLKNIPTSPQEDKPQNRIGDMTGLISKAKEGLAKSKSKGDISRSPSVDHDIKKVETKKSENELHWEELARKLTRPLTLCDLDFTDLNDEDEKDVLAPRGLGGSVPPPPPPIGIPPPISGMAPPFNGRIPPPNFPPPPTNLVPPPNFGYATLQNRQNNETTDSAQMIKKNKKTVKLFWKEVREDMIPPTITKTVWDELPKTVVDIQKLEHLFESRAKDLMTKKQQELNKNKEIIVLDHKRSNAINIAMTKLPPPRAIKAAILKMDQTVVTREGIDKLLNMLPSDEERAKIQEAQVVNPELPLGSAEQFLLTLSSISELSARLKLWAFKLDFENTEKEIAEPLNDLKQGLELLKANKTFKCILSTLLSIGIFLNGAPVKGFQIEYLAKVPEVKDTVHKHSLLHHLCHMVMESSSDTTDLYSEIGPITRASKADFTELAHNITYLETECKASWDRLKVIAKHDCPTQLKQKLVDFLADCAERIIILEVVHRRVINRYRKFLLWLGIPQHRVVESKPNEFCRILSEFALEYRTTRERVLQQIEKKANHRERNKTRGKLITDVGKFKTQEDRADDELKQLLGSSNSRNDTSDGTLTWRRRRAEELRSPIIKQNEESFTDGDDEILESLVKTATKAPGTRPTPRERKRTRHADRKSYHEPGKDSPLNDMQRLPNARASVRRTLKNGLTEEEKQHVAAIIKTY